MPIALASRKVGDGKYKNKGLVVNTDSYLITDVIK